MILLLQILLLVTTSGNLNEFNRRQQL